MIKKLCEIAMKNRLITEGLVSFVLMVGIVYAMGMTLSNEYLSVLIILIAVSVIVHFGFCNYNKKRLKYSLFLAVPLSLALCVGKRLTYQGVETGSAMMLDAFLVLVYIVLFALMGVSVLAFIDKKSYVPKVANDQLFKKKSWFWYCVIILLCWLPLFLVFFPGLISVDSAVQLRQAIGEGVWSNWHPVLHTLFIAIPTNIGLKISGDLTAGIALATIFQMVVLSVVFGYVVKWVLEKTAKKWIGICFLIYFAVCPVIACYAVTMWKDVLFSAFFVLAFIKIYDLVDLHGREYKVVLKDVLKIMPFIILIGFLRNGGILVVATFGVALLIYFKEARKMVAFSFLVVLLLIKIIQGPIYSALNIASSPFMESLSIPAQQFGYIAQNGKLSDEETEKLSKFADVDCLREEYTSMNADPAKNCFDYGVVESDKMELISVWFDMLPRHVTDYVTSYMLQTFSYWYPQSSVWVLDINHTHDAVWLKTEYTDLSLMGDSMRDGITKVEEGLVYSSWMGWINNTGVLFWTMLSVLIVFIYQKKYKMLVPLSGVIIYIISLLVASPVSSIFRYVYVLLLLLPILVMICFLKKKEKRR